MLRVDVSKNSITALSSNEGEFDTSTTTSAPATASASPSPGGGVAPRSGAPGPRPVPLPGEAGTGFEPVRPGPPKTTNFIVTSPSCWEGGDPARTYGSPRPRRLTSSAY